jgi:hypothetical protein
MTTRGLGKVCIHIATHPSINWAKGEFEYIAELLHRGAQLALKLQNESGKVPNTVLPCLRLVRVRVMSHLRARRFEEAF